MAKLWKGAMEFFYDTTGGEDWTPTIGIVGPDNGNNADAMVVTEAVGRAILEISSNQVILGDIRTGTWTPDSSPYNPEASLPKTLGLEGQRLTNGNVLDLEIVWKLVKNVGGGLPGALNLRGVLGEGDVEAIDTGRWNFQDGSAAAGGGTMVGYMNTALAAFLSAGDWPYKLAVITRPLIGKLADGTKVYGSVFARVVRSFAVDGVGSLNLTKRRKPLGGSRVPILPGVPATDLTVNVLNDGAPGLVVAPPDVPTYSLYIAPGP